MTSRWYTLAPRTSWVALGASFTREGLVVGVNFYDADPAVNLARFQALHRKKDQFELALGEGAVWDEKTGRRVAVVSVISPFDGVADVDQWPAMIDWLIDQHARFREAVEAVGGLESLG